MINSGDANEIAVGQSAIPLIVGREYTISCYVRAVSGTISFKLQYGTEGYYLTKIFEITQTDWKKVSYTFTAASAPGTAYFVSRAASTGEVEVCGMKLEVGNKATGWCPSPWDMVSRSDYNALADRVAILESK